MSFLDRAALDADFLVKYSGEQRRKAVAEARTPGFTSIDARLGCTAVGRSTTSGGRSGAANWFRRAVVLSFSSKRSHPRSDIKARLQMFRTYACAHGGELAQGNTCGSADTMLIDLQYRDDGFRVDVTLITREEQALSDVLIARDVWWPDQMNWIVFPVLASPRKRKPPRIPSEQKWMVQRMPSPLKKDEAVEMVRLHNQNASPDSQLAEAQLAQIMRSWEGSPAWVLARIDFPE